jgi:hypothetical protein
MVLSIPLNNLLNLIPENKSPFLINEYSLYSFEMILGDGYSVNAIKLRLSLMGCGLMDSPLSRLWRDFPLSKFLKRGWALVPYC